MVILAILELIRLKQIRAAQEEGEFTDILIMKSEEAEETPLEEQSFSDFTGEEANV